MDTAVEVGKRKGKKGIAAGVVLVLVLAGVIGAVATATKGGGAQGIVPLPAAPGMATATGVPEAPVDDMARQTVSEEAGWAADGDVAVRAGGEKVLFGTAEPAPGAPQADAPDARVIKTADLSIVLADDGFNTAFDSASKVAATYGGFVVDSSTEGTHAKAGSLTIRVPVDRFEAALSDLRGLGIEIEREDSSGVDVTDQFVDLNARLRSWEAQHRVLLKLMDQANSIGETMQVQNEIQRVQYEIEAIKGQLRVLRDQSSMATITVAMHERGVATPKTDAERPSLAVAFDTAWSAFLGVISAVIIGLGYLVPVGVIALAVFLVWRRTRKVRPAAGSAG